MRRGRRAVFLDRDGVIVRPTFRGGRSFAPTSLRDFTPLPRALQAMRRLKQAGYWIVVVTNQPDVGAGKLDRRTVEAMHRRLRSWAPLDDIRVCYHTSDMDCSCRKPSPGMLLQASRRWNIDLINSIMIGDRWSDIEAGRAARCFSIFIDHGYDERAPKRPDLTVKSLNEAADFILGRRR
jgi:D-glycero-D-manno-heptose 1,7-bisphosphate phosphatase